MNNTALIFPGQGSQYQGMGMDATKLSKSADKIYKTASSILKYDIKDISFNADIETISNTKVSKAICLIINSFKTSEDSRIALEI